MTEYNFKNENIVDVEFDDVQNVIYLSAPQLAKKIGTTEATIRTWADMYGDLIGIEKINGRKTYKETQVPCFAFIKDLVESKNMKKTQVRNYISKHGFKYAEFNSGLVDPKDPLGFQALASALSVEVHKELDNFKKDVITEVINQVDSRLKQYILLQGEAIDEVLDNTVLKVDEIVTERVNTELTNFKTDITEKISQSQESTILSQKENLDYFTNQINGMIEDQKEFQQKQETDFNDAIQEFIRTTTRMEKREQEKKNSFWSKLFKNK